MNRRTFLARSATGIAILNAGGIHAHAQVSPPDATANTNVTEVVRKRGPQDLGLVRAFVGAGHNNLPRVRELVVQDPQLVHASLDWGGGDWETALGGASHTGHREIAEYLLSAGARMDCFCAAMLGEREALLPLLAAHPSIAATKGPHGYTLLYHTAIGGIVEIAEALKPILPANAPDYNQALSAAARDGRLEMTKWLLDNGVTNPNVPDGFNKTALMFAVEKHFPEIETLLRAHGAHDIAR